MAKYKVNSKEKLEKILSLAGIKGEWVLPDENGFSRIYEFTHDGKRYKVLWFYNLSTLIYDNLEFWFDYIETKSTYPKKGEWIAFGYRDYRSLLHMKVGEEAGYWHDKRTGTTERLEYEITTLIEFIEEEDTDYEDFCDYKADIRRISRQIVAIKAYENKRRKNE